MAEGDFTVRVPEQGSGEFSPLSKTFHCMAEELQRAEERRQTLTVDVVHELRTPIHILQRNLEGIQDGICTASPEPIEAMLEEIRLLTHLVEDLQTLSLAIARQLVRAHGGTIHLTNRPGEGACFLISLPKRP